MKAKDLIEQLQKFDPELEVVVDGYETGADFVTRVEQVKVFKHEDYESKSWYNGDCQWLDKPNEHPKHYDTGEKLPGEILDVVYIPRNS